MGSETVEHSGGCQCGAVRYRIKGSIREPHLCHCRMCQKAAGNYFLPIGSVRHDQIEWTRGAPSHFRSSQEIARGFCNQCGTPLTFELDGHDSMNITLGSLDHPAAVPPVETYGSESQMPWIADICARVGRTTEQEKYRDGERIKEVAESNRQHPDHDTQIWPPK